SSSTSPRSSTSTTGSATARGSSGSDKPTGQTNLGSLRPKGGGDYHGHGCADPISNRGTGSALLGGTAFRAGFCNRLCEPRFRRLRGYPVFRQHKKSVWQVINSRQKYAVRDRVHHQNFHGDALCALNPRLSSQRDSRRLHRAKGTTADKRCARADKA